MFAREATVDTYSELGGDTPIKSEPVSDDPKKPEP